VRRRTRSSRAALALALLAVTVVAPPAAAETAPSRALRSVVTITTADGQGSGFVFGDARRVVTNQHVVGEAREVQVRLDSGRRLTGEVVETDARADLAVVRVREALTPLPGRDARPEPGEEVFALGAPLGLSGSVAKGVVSAMRQDGPAAGLIQVDVPVNPGNSGGPLIDARGRVLGVTTSKLAEGEGIAFAVPVAQAGALGTREAAPAPAPAAPAGPAARTSTSPTWATTGLLAALAALLGAAGGAMAAGRRAAARARGAAVAPGLPAPPAWEPDERVALKTPNDH
jgi:putative serine protease PepD